MTDTFKCANCGGTFRKLWSDADAQAEAQEVFGGPVDDGVLVCDDCYEAIQGWARRTGELGRERERLARLRAQVLGRALRAAGEAEHP